MLRFQVLTKHPYHVDMRRSVRLTPARLLGWLCLWEAGGTAWGYVHISDFGIQPKASSIALASKGGRDAISVAAIGIAHPDVAPVCPLYLISLSLSLSSLPLRRIIPFSQRPQHEPNLTGTVDQGAGPESGRVPSDDGVPTGKVRGPLCSSRDRGGSFGISVRYLLPSSWRLLCRAARRDDVQQIRRSHCAECRVGLCRRWRTPNLVRRQPEHRDSARRRVVFDRSDSDMSYVGVEANSMYTGTTAGQGIRIEHVVQCEGAPPGPCQTASCTAAVFLYRQANVRAYFTCLSETNLEVGSPSSSTLSNVLNSADCIGSTTGVAALAPVIEACLSHCEYRAFRCYTEPALNATCKPYLIVAELGRERGAPVTFNLTNMLLPGTNAVQQACTAAPIGMARGVQPPPPGAAATCVANIGTCVDDPECNHCFEVMKLSASLRVNTSELLQNCTDARAFAMLETMFKPSSCASVAAAGADDEWAGLQPHGPNLIKKTKQKLSACGMSGRAQIRTTLADSSASQISVTTPMSLA